MNDTKKNYKEKITVTYLLVFIFLLLLADLSTEVIGNHNFNQFIINVVLKIVMLVVVLITANYVWQKFRNEKAINQHIIEDLLKAQTLAQDWEQKSKIYQHEYQAYVVQQLNGWLLSKSEKEIALQLLQGKTSKDIASMRYTSERTIRNQCRAIYEKSNVSSKSEFSAHFLNELVGDISL